MIRLNYIHANLLAFLLFILAHAVGNLFDVHGPTYIIGLLYLFFVTPFTISQTIRIKSFSWTEKYFVLLTIFFFIYTPLFFLLNHAIGLRLSPNNILTLNIALFVLVFTFKRKRDEWDIPISIYVQQIKKHIPLIGTLVAFVIIHAINFHFYTFIPEWDSYGDLLKIQDNLNTGLIVQNYREFFITATSILSSFSGVDPYKIFSVVFILLQSTLILTINKLLDDYKITGIATRLLALLGSLSIPVINMEIDMVRPQNIFIIFLPIFIYFLYRARMSKNILYAVFSGIILALGFKYHEFFVFPFVIFLIWLASLFTVKFLLHARDQKDRIIFGQGLIILFITFLFLKNSSGITSFVIITSQKILSQIFNVSAWKLWFINQYSSDGEALQMGWSGWVGALKYYGYYAGPLTLFIFLVLLYFIAISVRQNSLAQALKTDAFLRVTVPFLLVFFGFAEILPRMNYLYLPERFWVFIDMFILLLFVPILKYLQTFFYRRTFEIFLIIAFASLIVGMSGSFYVAAAKKSLTSKTEFEAAQWIRSHTPKDSLLVSQSANGPMIMYFANRNLLTPSQEYFTSTEVLEPDYSKTLNILKASRDQNLESIDSLVEDFTSNKIPFFTFADTIQNKKATIESLNKQIKEQEFVLHESRYIVFSYNKFDTFYSQRDWWLKANAYGANIEKFNKSFPLVYNKGGVYIWKIR